MIWYDERLEKHVMNTTQPKFSLCCSQGKIQLPFLTNCPQTLQNLYFKRDARSNFFWENIRSFNMMFSFTSLGGRIDTTINKGTAPPTFIIMDRDKIESPAFREVKLRLLGKRSHDARRYNLPSASKVAALIVGDFDSADAERDIIVETQSGLLRRVSIVSPAYLPLYGKNLGSKRLFQQLAVDFFSTIESARLAYLRMHHKELRADMYKGLSEAYLRGENNSSKKGKCVILPATFINGARYMIQIYQDAMAICRWADILIYLLLKGKGLKAEDRPDIVCRVFKIKLDQFIKEIKRGKVFGKVKSVMYTIEFQKRGLPHAHILIFLHHDSKYPSPEDIDKIISAEIPDENEDHVLHSSVTSLMIHGPCGVFNPTAPCMEDRKCTRHFPKKINDRTSNDKDGYPLYKRRDNGRVVKKGKNDVDNRFVVPYNPYLMKRYKAHTNYINKAGDSQSENYNEIKMYVDCRYLPLCEAMWRIFALDVHFREPAVERLPIHLPNEQVVFFDGRPHVLQSIFLAWMDANSTYTEAKGLTYAEFPAKFVWKQPLRAWTPRKKGFSVGRIHYVAPGSGELYYLRILLNIIRGLSSYTELRTINNVVYPTFRDACYAIGLLDDNKEYIDSIEEASHWGFAKFLRNMFTTLLLSNQMARPEYNYTATRSNKSLADFPTMSFPNMSLLPQVENRLICDELNYDRSALAAEHSELLSSINDEQMIVYDKIMVHVNERRGGLFFLYGYGGTDKTYIWRTLSATLRSKGEIVLAIASSGIASLLIPGGRTAHSRFIIPFNVHEESTCNIACESPLAELITKAKLIIWDEAPMIHKHYFEAVHQSLKDILSQSNPENENKPFGGKTVVFGGDFRQILPAVPKGTRQQVVSASINSSHLWQHCEVLTLTKNMRLSSKSDGTNVDDNDGVMDIEIPDDLLIQSSGNHLASIAEETYPNLLANIMNSEYLQQRAILAPTNEIVEKVNDYMLPLVRKEEKVYLSFDSPCTANETVDSHHDIHTLEFLNTITSSGLPTHELKLKKGFHVMLLRNIDQSNGLCNGTRLTITRLRNRVLEAKIISGSNVGQKVFIPRLSLTPSDSRIPFHFQRRQFPIVLSFAMTINKSQGQSLQNVGLYLEKPVFSHGQLYVAISRVTGRKSLKILIVDKERNTSKKYNKRCL
ncbi:hypothetical protein ABFS83_03G034600 [Erythranthe nasuta]